MLNQTEKELLGALIGLSHVVYNNPKTENTDGIIIESLRNMNSETSLEWIKKVNEEKYLISPSCKTCTHPCGNSDNYDFKDLEKEDKKIQEIKIGLIKKAILLANEENPDISKILQCIAVVGYQMGEEHLKNILEN